MKGLYPPGTALIEKINPHGRVRDVIAASCPSMFNGAKSGPNLSHRQWGYYRHPDYGWEGPWHTDPERLEPHPDADRVWAEFVAAKLKG